MSGRKIDDHSFFGGKHSKASVFPEGVHTKEYKSSEGSGHVDALYPDTTEMVHRDQMKGDSQVKKHPIKPGYRN